MERETLKKIQKILLICGIISMLLYFGMDVLCSRLYVGFNYADQAISELSAIGAPTRGLWIALSCIFIPLVIAFGIGALLAAGRKRSLKVTGILISIWGFLGFVWFFFPMNMRGNIGSVSDTGHLVLSAVTVLLLAFFIVFGSGAKGKGFRVYSILTILVMLFFGALVGMQASRVAANLPTPGMGIMERVSVFSPMIWVIALAIVLLIAEKEKELLVNKRRRT